MSTRLPEKYRTKHYLIQIAVQMDLPNKKLAPCRILKEEYLHCNEEELFKKITEYEEEARGDAKKYPVELTKVVLKELELTVKKYHDAWLVERKGA